ncbi:hypothetical protein [Azospirillum largimobile]
MAAIGSASADAQDEEPTTPLAQSHQVAADFLHLGAVDQFANPGSFRKKFTGVRHWFPYLSGNLGTKERILRKLLFPRMHVKFLNKNPLSSSRSFLVQISLQIPQIHQNPQNTLTFKEYASKTFKEYASN